jgi:hypothetical protein
LLVLVLVLMLVLVLLVKEQRYLEGPRHLPDGVLLEGSDLLLESGGKFEAENGVDFSEAILKGFLLLGELGLELGLPLVGPQIGRILGQEVVSLDNGLFEELGSGRQFLAGTGTAFLCLLEGFLQLGLFFQELVAARLQECQVFPEGGRFV